MRQFEIGQAQSGTHLFDAVQAQYLTLSRSSRPGHPTPSAAPGESSLC